MSAGLIIAAAMMQKKGRKGGYAPMGCCLPIVGTIAVIAGVIAALVAIF